MEFLWDSLTCGCGSIHFIPTIEIRWKKGSGTAIKQTGTYQCLGCHEPVNTSELITRKQKEQIEKEVEALRGQA